MQNKKSDRLRSAKIKRGLRPEWSLYLWGMDEKPSYRETFRFGYSWIAITIVLLLDIVFLFPAFSVFQDAVGLWQQSDDLFRLTGALFTTFWLVGWSMAPLLLTLILLLLLFAREELRVRSGELDVRLGLPFIGLRMTYQIAGMRNLRIEQPQKGSGTSWRGNFAMFDYGANKGEFGVRLTAEDVVGIGGCIESASGVTLRTGEALPEELTGEWLATRQQLPAEALVTKEERPALTSTSSVLLIAANIIPLLGAILWGWDLGAIMLLYWAESAVIGFFNVCKIIVVSEWAAFLLVPFFLGHFGGFMSIHFLFLYSFFLKGSEGGPTMDASMDDVAMLFLGVWPALLALLISHGYSFFHNFIGHKEYIGRSGQAQMSEPYRRIIFMHLVIIFGGGLALILGNPAPVIMGVIVLKTAFDLRGHLKQREASQKRASA